MHESLIEKLWEDYVHFRHPHNEHKRNELFNDTDTWYVFAHALCIGYEAGKRENRRK